MATEEFKTLTEQLLGDYLELRVKAKGQGIDTLTISFKDYLDFYIKYIENTEHTSLYDDDEDLEDEDSTEE